VTGQSRHLSNLFKVLVQPKLLGNNLPGGGVFDVCKQWPILKAGVDYEVKECMERTADGATEPNRVAKQLSRKIT